MPVQPQIPGGTIIPAGSADYTLAPEVTPLSVSTLPADGSDGLWWKFTAPQHGRLNFDSMLSMYADGSRVWYDPSTTIQVFLADDFTLLDQASSGIDPQQGSTLRGSVALTVDAGVTYFIYITSGGPYLRVLRVSDWAEMTDWAETSDVVTIAQPNVPFDDLSDVSIQPDAALHRHGDALDSTYEGVVDPMVARLGWFGRAGVTHYPLTPMHPYEFYPNWQAIYGKAQQGPTGDAFNGGPDAGEWTYGVPNIAEQSDVDLPIGLETFSSATDATPPDGHQTIRDTMYAQHQLYNLTRMIEGGGAHFDGPVHQQVRADAPITDSPGGSAILDWREPIPTLRDVELRATRRIDSPYNNATYAEFAWRVGINPQIFEGTQDPDTGYWRIGPDITDVAAGGFGLNLRGRDVVADVLEDPEDSDDLDGLFHVYGDEAPQVRGTEVLAIPGDDDDWYSIGDESTVAALLAHEKETQYPDSPGGDVNFAATNGFGGLVVSGIPYYISALYAAPDGGYDNTDQQFNLLQYPAVRFTWIRPDHRWIFPPVIPPVVTGVPPRRIFGRSDGATHGAARIFGGGNTVQSGNRTLGSIL